ncbi:MAG TPA: hypothetical protein VJX74_16165 [Blastocatellia bacterium]|nr:hypothetical protein [Blastocatellia bacterium]
MKRPAKGGGNRKHTTGNLLAAISAAWERCIEAVRAGDKETYLRSLAWCAKVITLCSNSRVRLSEEVAKASERGIDWSKEIIPLSERDELMLINDSYIQVRALIAGIQRAASDYMARFPDATANETSAALSKDQAFKMTMAQITALCTAQNALTDFSAWLETDASAAWLKSAMDKIGEPEGPKAT